MHSKYLYIYKKNPLKIIFLINQREFLIIKQRAFFIFCLPYKMDQQQAPLHGNQGYSCFRF